MKLTRKNLNTFRTEREIKGNTNKKEKKKKKACIKINILRI